VQTAKNKKVALYARVSTEKQEKGLEAQQRALEEYCKTRSIDDFVLFSDEAVSGAKSSRPGLNKMMIDVRAGKIRSVVVYSFSRFARSTTHLLDTLEEFRKLEVTFVSLTENIDTNGPMGKLIFTIFAAIAELRGRRGSSSGGLRKQLSTMTRFTPFMTRAFLTERSPGSWA
jgi:DNA invertase Pin-like site-specific DNA recombinase